MSRVPLLSRIFIGWIIVATAVRFFAGGPSARVAESAVAGCAVIIVVYVAFTHAHRIVGRRLDAGQISNEEYVQQVAAHDLWWCLPLLAVTVALALRDSPGWWVTLVAPLTIFAALSLFVAKSGRVRNDQKS